MSTLIYYEDLPLSTDIKKALAELEINYAFQPIFYPDGKTIYAHEALMRPVGTTVTELIEDYTNKDQLHVLEVATFWGATQAYFTRGYVERLSVNSFPCEVFTEDEAKTYVDFFGSDKNILMIEVLEYPEFSLQKSMKKRDIASIGDSILALDDYGSGLNDMSKVEILDPQVIKIDRSLLSGIDKDIAKQNNCKDIIISMHALGKLVVAEGVETKEEFDYLVGLGADLFQGYYLARPE